MTLSLALAAAALLTAQLPEGPPPFGSNAPSAASPTPRGAALPEGHPAVGANAPAPSGTLPEGHPATTGRPAPSADELIQQLEGMNGLREREKTFEIAASLGKLYYTNGRPKEAIEYFLQAEAKAQGARELFVAQRKKLGAAAVPGAEQAGCGFTERSAVEAMEKVAAERAKKGDSAGAAACARAALAPVLDVEAMRGNAMFLTGDGEGALKVYERVLDVAPTHADALFGRSALLYELKGEDTKSLRSAREGFEAFVAAHPDSTRSVLARKLSSRAEEALKAGGMKKWLASRAEDRRVRSTQLALPPSGPMMAQQPPPRGPMQGGGQPMQGGASAPMISQETMDAMQNVERTPELEAQLTQTVEQGEELLARGRYDEALTAYRQVMPLRPDGRVKAGLAWTLVGLGKPTADRVWGVAVSSDPAAVDKLGETLKAKGDTRGAKALWTKLAASAPDYAASASLQAKMAP